MRMSKISWLLTSTALIGIAGGHSTNAADFGADSAGSESSNLAVSAFNGRFEGRAATEDGVSAFAAIGSFTAPLGGPFGFQVDALVGAVDEQFAGAVAAHWFWRDPSVGLLGGYAEIGHASAEGGITTERAAVEAELYLDRFTASGLFGYQFADDGDGFFSKESLSYYPTDDLRLYVSHSYLPGDIGHTGGLGTEWLTPLVNDSLALYGEGRYHEGGAWGATGGLRVYFGPTKPLILRQRQDDPPDHFDLFLRASAAGIAARDADGMDLEE
jgi:hypothetical protein